MLEVISPPEVGLGFFAESLQFHFCLVGENSVVMNDDFLNHFQVF